MKMQEGGASVEDTTKLQEGGGRVVRGGTEKGGKEKGGREGVENNTKTGKEDTAV